ncbi:MAG: tetratricopeptide repeat protein [Gemmatimonadota bacterium]
MKRRRRTARTTEPRITGEQKGAEHYRPALTRRRLAGLLLAVAVMGVAAVLVLLRGRADLAPDQRPLPAGSTPSPDSGVSAGDFVGSRSCEGCHATEFGAWRASTHARAGGPPEGSRLIVPFDGTPIRFRDAEVLPVSRGGSYSFVVRQSGREERTFRIDGVVGGGHMAGGGTQGFVTRHIDGTLRFLPFDFSRQASVWFCNTGTRTNQGWVPITPSMSLADCGDWPPIRNLGDDVRYANCQSCHGSQITVALDPSSGGFRTSLTSLDINCESCHGPGRPHITAVGDTQRLAAGDIAMTSLATVSKDASLATCWRCHALKAQIRPGWLPGRDFDAYYATGIPRLGDAAHYPDGRVRTFAYQQGHLYSDCYVSGGMTCTSCHDPHSQRYRTVNGEPLPGRFDDRQCTSCHASKLVEPVRHTRHASSSEVSRCTSCHMPYLQEPEVGGRIPFARSDHSIPIPRPAADSALGVRSACRSCHADRGELALDSIVRAWYGELKPLNPTVAGVRQWRVGSSASESARLLLDTAGTHTAGLIAGLSRFLENHVVLDDPEPDAAAWRRLAALSRHRDVDVRALALASLHAMEGRSRRTRSLLIEALGAPDAHLLRPRWAIVLGFLADRARGAANPLLAATAYRRALEIDSANPRLHLNLGLALADARQSAEAITSYQRSLELDPLQPLALVNLGIAIAARGDAAAAAQAWERALTINRHEPLAHFNLANFHLLRGDLGRAEAGYRAALAADPSLASARFYLARIHAQKGEIDLALREIELGLEFDRGNAEALAARAQLRALSASRNRR